MTPSSQEVQLLYERVERLAEQASIAEELQRDNDDLRTKVRELRGEARALRRENEALQSKERADASDVVLICLHLASLGLSRSAVSLTTPRTHVLHHTIAGCHQFRPHGTPRIRASTADKSRGADCASQTPRGSTRRKRRRDRTIAVRTIPYPPTAKAAPSPTSASPSHQSISAPRSIVQEHHPQRRRRPRHGLVVKSITSDRAWIGGDAWIRVPTYPGDSCAGSSCICSQVDAAYARLALGLSRHSCGRQRRLECGRAVTMNSHKAHKRAFPVSRKYRCTLTRQDSLQNITSLSSLAGGLYHMKIIIDIAKK
jgi:hypothetical protein|eukprot:COSAG02_NODE_340_length_24179_cov_6.401644_3_plen_313_part_00